MTLGNLKDARGNRIDLKRQVAAGTGFIGDIKILRILILKMLTARHLRGYRNAEDRLYLVCPLNISS